MSIRSYLLTDIRLSIMGQAWVGPALEEALHGVTWQQAVSTPPAAIHSIAALTFHTVGWMEEVAHRLTGAPSGEPRRGNFPSSMPFHDSEWESWKSDLRVAFGQIAAALESFDEQRLYDPVPNADGTAGDTYFQMLTGLAQHNAYHAGQIVLLRKLLEV